MLTLMPLRRTTRTLRTERNRPGSAPHRRWTSAVTARHRELGGRRCDDGLAAVVRCDRVQRLYEKPPNTTECVAPMRAQASMAATLPMDMEM